MMINFLNAELAYSCGGADVLRIIKLIVFINKFKIRLFFIKNEYNKISLVNLCINYEMFIKLLIYRKL